ncbi:MAG TPA: adenosylcobinamide-GDP ribazoletransferase [Chroococcidiopsis sp.]
MKSVIAWVAARLGEWTAAIAFYTVLPVPIGWALEFQSVSRWVPWVGVLLGLGLGVGDRLLDAAGMTSLLRSAVVVGLWVWLTGGLHLDGAMDAADGLAVQNPEKRLQVMADSATGAFGAMAAIALMGLKTVALADITSMRWFALIAAAGWGRWAQQVAIARYPYLKPTGKGAFHKATLKSMTDTVPGLILMLGLSALPLGLHGRTLWALALGAAGAGLGYALLTPAWFNRKLGGHTGDTYGAVVEWTEAGVLVILALLI